MVRRRRRETEPALPSGGGRAHRAHPRSLRVAASMKIGLHAGACLAVTLNDRFDYFGQTMNIAAWVQGLGGADEIVVTDSVLSVACAADLVGEFELESTAVRLKGIAGEV